MRLDKLLSVRGICSRREASAFVRSGRVTLVSGRTADSADCKVDPDEVLVDGQALDPENIYLLLYKPDGFVCSHDDYGRLIYELLPSRFENRRPALQSVGRLDKDTTGLLMLTDDGALNHRLLAPRHHVVKVYEVWLKDAVSALQLEVLLRGGFCIEGDPKPVLPAKGAVLLDDSNTPETNKWTPLADVPAGSEIIPGTDESAESRRVLLSIEEGRFHQVKRMFEFLGTEVAKLHRCSFAGLSLRGLEEGGWRTLEPSELETLKNI